MYTKKYNNIKEALKDFLEIGTHNIGYFLEKNKEIAHATFLISETSKVS